MKLLHAFLTSNTDAPRTPSSAAMMCAVAGSTWSWPVAAKISRSTSAGSKPASAIAARAAATARVDEYSPSPTIRRSRTPDTASSVPGGTGSRPDASAMRRSISSLLARPAGSTWAMPAIWVTGGPVVGIEAEFTWGAVVAIRSPSWSAGQHWLPPAAGRSPIVSGSAAGMQSVIRGPPPGLALGVRQA